MPAFADILSTRLDDIKPPKNVPMGEYIGIVDALHEVQERAGAEIVTFPIRLARPINVDPTELAEALNGRQLSDVRVNLDFWRPTEPAGKFRLKQFLHDHLGIEAPSLGEALAQVQGRQLLVSITHRMSKEPGDERTFLQIKSTGRA